MFLTHKIVEAKRACRLFTMNAAAHDAGAKLQRISETAARSCWILHIINRKHRKTPKRVLWLRRSSSRSAIPSKLQMAFSIRNHQF